MLCLLSSVAGALSTTTTVGRLQGQGRVVAVRPVLAEESGHLCIGDVCAPLKSWLAAVFGAGRAGRVDRPSTVKRLKKYLVPARLESSRMGFRAECSNHKNIHISNLVNARTRVPRNISETFEIRVFRHPEEVRECRSIFLTSTPKPLSNLSMVRHLAAVSRRHRAASLGTSRYPNGISRRRGGHGLLCARRAAPRLSACPI